MNLQEINLFSFIILLQETSQQEDSERMEELKELLAAYLKDRTDWSIVVNTLQQNTELFPVSVECYWILF